MAVARRLERRLACRTKPRSCCSRRENFSLFTPMLPEVSSGELEVRHVVTPIRTQLAPHAVHSFAKSATIDVERRSLHYRTRSNRWTRNPHVRPLWCSRSGSSTSTFGLPGVAERVVARSKRSRMRMLCAIAWCGCSNSPTRSRMRRGAGATAHARRRRRRIHRRRSGGRNGRAFSQRPALLSAHCAIDDVRVGPGRRRPDAASGAAAEDGRVLARILAAARCRGPDRRRRDRRRRRRLTLQSGRRIETRDDRLERGRNAVADRCETPTCRRPNAAPS